MGIIDKIKKTVVDETPAPEAEVKVAKKTAKPAKEKKAEEKVAKKHSNRTDIFGILIRPLITEKTTLMAENNQYAFEVETGTNKIQVMKAIEARYGVKPVKVNMILTQGKWVRHGKFVGRHSDCKKAIVTLPQGSSITINEGV